MPARRHRQPRRDQVHSDIQVLSRWPGESVVATALSPATTLILSLLVTLVHLLQLALLLADIISNRNVDNS